MTRCNRGWLCLVALGLGLGCSGDAARDRDAGGVAAANGADDLDVEARWEASIAGLPGALLSVWGAGPGAELWAVGADARDGSGPMVVRGTAGAGWQRIDVRPVDAQGGHLWWVFGSPGDDEHVWIVGELGRVLRVARGSAGSRSDGDVERIASGTDAALYGIWGTSPDALWAVGGYVHPRRGPPTIVRLTPAGGEVVTLPAGLPDNGTFFKVWGAAADDVWVVGDKGMVLHWDGVAWADMSLAGGQRLVTVHGRDGDDMVAVGGTGEAVIVQGRGFVPAALGALSPLNGVFVEPGGDAWAVGMLGQVMRRVGSAGAWQPVASGVATRDWHAAWVDARGDLWVVGGDLLTRLDQGTLLRFGPARSDLPGGDVRGLEPSAEVSEGVEVVDDVEVEVVDEVEVSETIDIVDVAEAIEAIEDRSDPESSDPGPDGSEHDVTGDTLDADAPEAFELGWIGYDSGMFTAFPAGTTLAIVHGPQGGIHVEVAVRFACVTEGTELTTDIAVHLSVEGVEQARYLSAEYPVPVVAPGVCQSYIMPLIFDDPSSARFAGKMARVTAMVKPPGAAWERVLEAVLVDTM